MKLFFTKKKTNPSQGIDEADLNKHGFKVIANDDEKLHLSFYNGKDDLFLIISKERFKHKNDAIKFSEIQNLPLSEAAISLFLAMSGVCNQKNSFIHKALVFNFSNTPHTSYKRGIWAWSENDDDKVMLIWDGQDTEVDMLSVDDIKKIFKIEPTLPAICTNIMFS